jgi:hypothetical protein
MSIYNYLLTQATCPWCSTASDIRATFRFGLRELTEYHVGDRLIWIGRGVRTPRERPPDGNFQSDAYAECPACGKDFWLLVTVRDDVIVSASVDADREAYHKPQ